MQYINFKEKNGNCNQLAAVDTLGTFDFSTCLIALDALETSDLTELAKSRIVEGAFSDDTLLKLRKILPLAAHEYTHFVDATSTVWGINHLSMMNSAYLCDDRRGGEEHDFYKAKLFSDHLNRIKYPKYYTLVATTDDERPWVAQYSLGNLFGSDGRLGKENILFVRFSTRDGKLIARSPVSPVSVLEGSAMAQETNTELALINQHSDEFRAIESKSFSRRLILSFYNKQITEYSVCAHMVANQQKTCTNVLQALNLVSIIARVVLNSTKSTFEAILKADQIATVIDQQKDVQFVAGLKNGLKSQNIGILYFLIVRALPDDSYRTHDSAMGGMKVALDRLGINLGFLKQSASSHFNEVEKALSTSPIKSIARLASAAKSNFDIIGPAAAIPFDRLNIPKVMLNDGAATLIYPPENNRLSDFDIDACFNELAFGESWTKRFAEGCV